MNYSIIPTQKLVNSISSQCTVHCQHFMFWEPPSLFSRNNRKFEILTLIVFFVSWVRLCGICLCWVRLCGILPVLSPTLRYPAYVESDSAVSCLCWVRFCGILPMLSPTSQCPVHCRVRLRSVLFTAESDSAVSCPPLSPTPQCPVHCRVRLRSVLFTAKSDSAVSCTLQGPTPRCPLHCMVRLHRVLSTAYSYSAVSYPPLF